MINKLYLLLLFLLSACDEQMILVLKLAKNNPDQDICFSAKHESNTKVNGKYCVRYKGEIDNENN
jgi:hypothetical protein